MCTRTQLNRKNKKQKNRYILGSTTCRWVVTSAAFKSNMKPFLFCTEKVAIALKHASQMQFLTVKEPEFTAFRHHTTSRPFKWPREVAMTKNKEAQRPRIALAWEEGANYCCDKPWSLLKQLDQNVAGERKLVPAVWPWSMPLQTGDRVQLCGLIIYSYNTAVLETSGTQCIYLHSCVVALRLGEGMCACMHTCDSENNAGLRAHHP